MRRWGLVVAVALPGLLLAVFGLLHPIYLTTDTAHTWWTLHVWLVSVFPLLSVALVATVRGQRDLAAQLARLGAYAFAVLYTALDVLAGIGAGLAQETTPGTPVVDRLFDVGDRLGHTGVWFLAAAGLLAGVSLWRTGGTRGWPVVLGAVVFAVACYPFLLDHIFAPRGVVAMLGLAAGTALLEAARPAMRQVSPPGSPPALPTS